MANSLMIRVQQLKEGTHFIGWIKIGKSRFEWELKSRYKFRGPFKLVLKKDCLEIELENDEHALFYKSLVNYAIYICCNNEIRVFETLRNGVITDFGLANLLPEIKALLNRPKFNCQIT